MGVQSARLAEELIQCGFKSWLEGAHSQWIGVGPSPHPDPHKIFIEHPITEKILLSECCSQEWMHQHLELGASCCLVDPQWHLQRIDLVAGTLTQAASGQEGVER